MVAITRTRITTREYFELPETNLPMELIDGEIITMAAPKDPHQKRSGQIFVYLFQTIPDGEIRYAPTDVVLDAYNVVQPDIFWVSGEGSLCQLGQDQRWYGAPDLVVEIFSPGTRRRDMGDKFDLYEKHGTREYWMVDIDEQFVQVYHREGDRLTRQGLYAPGVTFVSRVLGEKTIAVDTLLGIIAM